jgi:prepilin-type N-terminal cleavage/methylation domain-containing protein
MRRYRGLPWARQALDSCRGVTLIELMFTAAIASTIVAMAIPIGLRVLDDYRTHSAARYLAQHVARARMEAIKRSTFVGLRFEAGPDDYTFTCVEDGNSNGVRSVDIARGVDRPLTQPEQLAEKFPGVAFGILAGVPDADGQAAVTPDGVRVGSSRILSMNPNGSSSSGTLYVHGRQRTQYAVRILGATGRVRTIRYVEPSGRWIDQ